MKIFGTIFPFVETNEDSLKLGRYVANYDFFKALLNYSNFDEYHLFCMNSAHFNQTKKKLVSEDIPDSQKNRVKLYLYNHLVDMISSVNYHIFHLGGWGYFFPGLTYIRNKYAKNIFPITGLIHSLNGKETNFHAFKMINSPLQPYDTIICSSKAGKQALSNIFHSISTETGKSFKGNFHIIPLGVNNNTPLNKTECRKLQNVPDNRIRLLTIGRISPITKYDPYPLISSFSDIIRDYPELDIELVIAGGANSSELTILKSIIAEEKMEQYIKIVPNFDDNLKAILYGSSDIYISLIDNLQETFGISIIEAMQASLPVVASDINGYKELIEDGKTGFKIPSIWCNNFQPNELSSIMDFSTLQLMLAQNMSLDLDIFKNKIRELSINPELRKEMGTAAQNKISKKYLWKDIIKEYEDLWDKLSSLSKSTKLESINNVDIFKNNYLNAFSHYPSKSISSDMVAIITSRGKNALKCNKLPIAYNNIQPLINNNNCLEVLKNLESSPVLVATLLDKITQFEILWMAKYGLISLNDKDKKID